MRQAEWQAGGLLINMRIPAHTTLKPFQSYLPTVLDTIDLILLLQGLDASTFSSIDSS